jgi:glycosyltransferase involved in cell wall biosynthesis
MRAAGRAVNVIELPGCFPAADAVARSAAAAALAALPDASVVVIDGLALPGFEAGLQAHAARLRIVGFIHHPLALETGLSAADAAHYAALEARLWRQMRGLICPSAATARSIAEAGVSPDRIAVSPPGTAKPARVRARPGGEVVHLLTVGTVSERKGHRLLIEALASLRAASWTLECVGSLERDPAAAAALRSAVDAAGLGHRVTLRGERSPAEVARAYEDADVFVLPSFHEGYGMAYAEALAYGLPVIATNAGAIPDTVPATAALFVLPGDVAALRAALENILGDTALRARLASGAARAGAALPDWPEAVARWTGALDRLVA